MLENIRIVLVRTFHPGNIGSTARSMKTMGLSDLVLVSPRDYPSPLADQMAAGAEDMLQKARVVDTLAHALQDCRLVVACSARTRSYDLPELNPWQAASKLHKHSGSSPVAVVFGPERMGLHNKDLDYAQHRVTIPANPDYNSLNLASAVQILSYEIYKTFSQPNSHTKVANQPNLATTEQFEQLLKHLESILRKIHFLRPHSGETMARIRHLLRRSQLTLHDTNILRGILRAIDNDKLT